ncbi:type II toxin-antitoxin system VapC family toxin [Brevundimonas sp.]|uniref:type II toxin-antitoxin system VapC family toxin n=1 Tax=Brevundimonas sp. TaxID=1871086 RepID=UPI0035658850
MTVYLDTSVVVPLFLDDDHAPRVRAWAVSDRSIVLSAWTVTEFSSALSMQVRLKNVTEAERKALERAFDRWSRKGQMLEFEADMFNNARVLLQRHSRLRAPDALHLAIALRNGVELATLDIVLRDAAVAEGMKVIDL